MLGADVNGVSIWAASLTSAPPVTFVKPTTVTATTINLPGGGTTSGYSAKLELWTNSAGTWSDGGTVWFIGANGETPASGTRYLAEQIGVDASGAGIWSALVPPALPSFDYTTIITADVFLSGSTPSQIFTFAPSFSGVFFVQADITGILQAAGVSGGNTPGEGFIAAYFLKNGSAPSADALTSAYVTHCSVPANSTATVYGRGSAHLFLRIYLTPSDMLTLNAVFGKSSGSGGSDISVSGFVQGAADGYTPGLTTNAPTQWSVYSGF